MVDRNELWAEAEDLADMIVKCPEIEDYQKAEAALKKHREAQTMMRELRELQDKIGDFRIRRVPAQYYQQLETQSESLFEKLEKIPEVDEFLRTQKAMNELLKSVTSRLSQAVLEHVDPEPGG